MGIFEQFTSPFNKKQMMSIIFLDETGQIHATIKPYNNNQFRIPTKDGEETYIIDPECVYYDPKKQMPTSIYYSGNPLPLKLKHTKEYGDKPEATIDANTLSKVIEDKVVGDLFKASDETINIKIVFWLLCFVAIECAWLVYRSFYG